MRTLAGSLTFRFFAFALALGALAACAAQMAATPVATIGNDPAAMLPEPLLPAQAAAVRDVLAPAGTNAETSLPVRLPESILRVSNEGGQLGFDIEKWSNTGLTGAFAVQDVYSAGAVPMQPTSGKLVSRLYAPTLRAAGSCIEAGSSYGTNYGYLFAYDWCAATPSFVQIANFDAAFLAAYTKSYPYHSTRSYVVEVVEVAPHSWEMLLSHNPDAAHGNRSYWVKVYPHSGADTGIPADAATDGHRAWDAFETHYYDVSQPCPDIPAITSGGVRFLVNGTFVPIDGKLPGTVYLNYRSPSSNGNYCISDDRSGSGSYYVQTDGTDAWTVVSKPSMKPAPTPPPVAYKSLYSFKCAPSDGSLPDAPLTAFNGSVYGTTENGGKYGLGTVFEVSSSGSERVVHDFKGPPDGATPEAPLTVVNGKLYGTTTEGGVNGYLGDGTVFTIDSAGTERVIYSFQGDNVDGGSPNSALVYVGGELYGTNTLAGVGIFDIYGTVYEISPTGVEHVLHSFGAVPYDAESPNGVTYLNGTLYGGAGGGANSVGAVFAVTTAGKERVIYNFPRSGGAGDPTGPLATIGDVLYGTTSAGGSAGTGTVYAMTTAGKISLLHQFAGGPDSAEPNGGVIAVDGALYGTTSGLAYGDYGSVFETRTSGAERVLYSFGSVPEDGAAPTAGLLYAGGRFFGTTSIGGKYGCGTVFSVSI